MANIGFATLSVIPSLRGMEQAMNSQLSGMMPRIGATAGQQMGSGITSSLGRALSGVASTIGNVLYGAAQTAGVAVGGILSTAIGKGLSRLVGIEEAQAKLRGLGHDAETIQTIMDAALESVLGTAFGLQDAATVAAQVVAAGVEPGEELLDVLQRVADTATIAGDDLTNIGLIFAQIIGSGRVMTQDLRQLEARGIPVFKWLADEMGVSMQAMREMVSEGEVQSETFLKVVRDNIAGAALESGQTTRGAFRNLGAALSRFGAVILGPFFTEARDLFNGLITVFDDLGARFGPAMDRLAESEGFRRFQDMIRRIPELLLGAVDAFSRFRRALAPIGAFIGASMLVSLRNLAGMFGLALPAINPFIAALVALALTFPQVRAALSGVFDAIRQVVEGFRQGAEGPVSRWVIFGQQLRNAWEAVKDLFAGPLKTAVEDLRVTFSPLVDEFQQMADIEIHNPLHWLDDLPTGIEGFGELLTDATGALRENDEEARTAAAGIGGLITAFLGFRAVTGIIGAIGSAASGTGSLLSGLSAAVGGPVGLIAIALAGVGAALWHLWETNDGFRQAVTDAWENHIQPVIQQVSDWFTGTAAPALAGAWQWLTGAAQSAGTAIGTAWTNIQAVVGPVVAWFSTHVAPTIGSVFGFIGSAASLMFEIVSTVFGWIGKVVGTWIGFLWNLISGFVELVMPVWEAVWNFIAGIVEELFGPVVTWIEDRLADIRQFFDNAREVVDTVREIFSDVSETISEKIDEAAAWVEELPDRILGFFSDAGSLLFGIGEQIIQGLWDGMKNIWNNVTGWIGGLGDWIRDNKGPASKDRVLLKPAGQLIIGGLREGMQAEWASTQAWLQRVAPQLAGMFDPISLPNVQVGFDQPLPLDKMPLPAGRGDIIIEEGAVQINNPEPEPGSDSLMSATLAYATSSFLWRS